MEFDSAKRDPSYLEWIAMFHLRPNGSAASVEQTTFVQRLSDAAAGWAALRGTTSEDHPRGRCASEFSALLGQHVLLHAGFFELQVEALDGEGQREIRHLLLFRFEPRDAELLEATTVELD
jgi:hypothetical protein